MLLCVHRLRFLRAAARGLEFGLSDAAWARDLAREAKSIRPSQPKTPHAHSLIPLESHQFTTKQEDAQQAAAAGLGLSWRRLVRIIPRIRTPKPIITHTAEGGYVSSLFAWLGLRVVGDTAPAKCDCRP